MNLYDLLNLIIVNKKFALSPKLFTEKDREKLIEEEIPVFDLLKNISSLCTQTSNNGVEFHPSFVMADGRRTFAVEDISENDYERLNNLEFEKVPLILRALVADILWVNKKNYKASVIAAKAYWELFKLWYENEDSIYLLDMIQRAVCISVQTNQTTLFDEIQEWLKSYIINAGNKDAFFTLRLMELFSEQKKFEVSIFLPLLDDLITSNKDDIAKVEQAYELKTECLFKLKRTDEAIQNNISLADFYLIFAESIVRNDNQGVVRAVNLYKKAILLYRNNGKPQKAEKTHRRLVDIQKEIPKTMIPLSFEFDIRGVIDNIRINMEGLSFEESVIRLTQMITFEKQDDIKSRVIEELKEHPFPHLFGKSLINSQGQTILTIPPLDISEPEKDPQLFEICMHQNALEKQKILGDIWIKCALGILNEKFSVEKPMIEFLVKQNPIIPEGREQIFLSGLYMFLKGEFYEAMHILAPQTENLFRNIAKESGGLTVTIDNDGSSMEKVLSSIFSLPELLDCYDNDILFTFKGLLNELAGANIRNEIAHGIMDGYTCSTGACLYFGVAIIKLLSFTSVPCYQIFKHSDKLMHFKMPSKDALKVIKR